MPGLSSCTWTSQRIRAAPEKGLGELSATSTTSCWAAKSLTPKEGIQVMYHSILPKESDVGSDTTVSLMYAMVLVHTYTSEHSGIKQVPPLI